MCLALCTVFIFTPLPPLSIYIFKLSTSVVNKMSEDLDVDEFIRKRREEFDVLSLIKMRNAVTEELNDGRRNKNW